MALPTPQYEPDKALVNMIVEPEETISSREDPLNLKQVDIAQRIFTVDIIMRMLAKTPPRIDLYAGFQRSTNLWTQVQQSRLIESMLIRIPIPVFYFDATEDNRWLVIDGLQRLGTLKNFIIDKNLKLTGLEFFPHLEGLSYDDLPADLRRRIDETPLTTFVINPGTAPEVKFIIFHRINTGGISLTAQEIRHALYNGQPADFVARLADLDEFKRATGYAVSPERMLDRDFITRFLAFYLSGPENYHPDMEAFMNKGMSMLYPLSGDQLAKIEADFRKSMNLAYEIFGERAFRKWYEPGETKKPLNKALFDVWSYTFAKLSEDQIKTLQIKKSNLLESYYQILQFEEDFTFSISMSTGDKNRVWLRFQKIDSLVQKILAT